MSYSKKDAPTRFYFDSEALPERDRFGAMCEEVMRRYGGIDVVKRDDAPLRTSSDVRRVGALRIAEIASRPLELVRTPELMRDGDDALCVTLTRSGVACMTQCGDEQRAYAGGGMIFDYGRVGHFFLDYGHAGKVLGTEGSRYCNLKIVRSRILTLVPRLTQPAGALLDKDPVALRLLFGYLARTIDIDLQEGGRAARLYEDHIVDLVALSLGAARDQQVLIEERSMRAVRRGAILREIEMHMDDPNLSAAAVGAKLGVTARYVHLLLEETGRSFNQHVLDRRLERAAELLRDPRHQHRRVGDIAFELGFIDLSHFNRAFRRRFGDTPSGVRALASRAK